MKNRTWIYLTNPFDAATARSYRMMRKIGAYTLHALQAYLPPPAFAKQASKMLMASENIFSEMVAILQPLADNYDMKYDAWKAQKSGQKSTTSSLVEKLALLRSEKIRQWDVAIQAVYEQGSTGYKALLPNRRKPFQIGSQEDIISALSGLNDLVTKDGELSTTLKAEISSFYSDLKNSKKLSAGGQVITKGDSVDVEKARIAYCTGLYEVLSSLMLYFKDDPEQGAMFFDLESIRNIEQLVFERTLKGGQTTKVMKHGFDAEDELRINNDGDAPVRFYLVANEDDAPEMSVIVAPNKEVVLAVNRLGNTEGRYLMAHNETEKVKGHFVVTLM